MSYPFEDDKYATLPEDDFIVDGHQGAYVCLRCEPGEGCNGSDFHVLPE